MRKTKLFYDCHYYHDENFSWLYFCKVKWSYTHILIYMWIVSQGCKVSLSNTPKIPKPKLHCGYFVSIADWRHQTKCYELYITCSPQLRAVSCRRRSRARVRVWSPLLLPSLWAFSPALLSASQSQEMEFVKNVSAYIPACFYSSLGEWRLRNSTTVVVPSDKIRG